MTLDQMRAQLFNAYERREAAKAQADAADVEIRAIRSAIAGWQAAQESAPKDEPAE